MPVISRFLGIVIAMYWDDHTPPHFHAKYGKYEITVGILDGVIQGKFARRALRLVLEWYELHTEELWEDWELCSKQEMPKPIDPLELKSMFLHIVNARYAGECRVEVSFYDERKGIADLREALHGPLFEPLKDQLFFARLSVNDELNTIRGRMEQI